MKYHRWTNHKFNHSKGVRKHYFSWPYLRNYRVIFTHFFVLFVLLLLFLINYKFGDDPSHYPSQNSCIGRTEGTVLIFLDDEKQRLRKWRLQYYAARIDTKILVT